MATEPTDATMDEITYKVVNSERLDTNLKIVADAIRSKGGTSASLAFPDGMAQAIADIEAGGAGGNYNIESVDDGNGGQILNITDAQGGATITDGIVVKARNANGYPTEVDYYNEGGIVNQNTFLTNNNSYPWYHTTTINLKNTITTLKSQCFRGCGVLALNLPDVTSTEGDTLRGLVNCKSIYLPKLTNVNNGQYVMGESKKLETVQIGSVGYGLTAIRSNTFWVDTQTNFTITMYTTGSYADAVLANARNGATNATIIIKASENTTYNGTAYAAGETMITSEVA